jgi:hypothetical protein
MAERSWEVAQKAIDIIQAQVLKGFLEAQGIEVYISQEGYEAAIGITGNPLADIEILVPNDQIEEAKKILADYHAGKFYHGEE